jgi:hypothetical protein
MPITYLPYHIIKGIVTSITISLTGISVSRSAFENGEFGDCGRGELGWVGGRELRDRRQGVRG